MGNDDVLRIEWPEPVDGETVLRHVETGEEREGTDLAGLRPGIWMASHQGGPLATDDPGFSLDGLLAYAETPRDREIRAFRTSIGTLALTVRMVEPYVEVATVVSDDGVIEVEGTIAYGEPIEGSARLLAVARKGPEPVGGPALFRGRRFEGVLQVAPMAETQTRRRVFWDLHAEVAGVRLPLAARLDDVTDKKAKVRFPAQRVGQIRARPYYTDTDSLAVALTVEEETS
ncbi:MULTISPECIES: hypothetical protein [Streptosporangium]|uniref:Acetoacetate decarboxylase n=1 Tax=Streptosporangium brasiliense TaxID=47480 RepID=A0ABT9R3T7_9ACTN|nr:hypothetical protein [Streptosporangium brasiliense]MDP9863882.1 hypothetical protein [Streptosporangium brasiliense]